MAAITKARNSNLIFKRYINLTSRLYAKPKKAVENKYSSTVLLPQTKFPSRLNGEKRIDMDNYLIEVIIFIFNLIIIIIHYLKMFLL